MLCRRFQSVLVNEKKDCLFFFQPHLLITMMVDGKFDCISENEDDIFFNALQKRYCRGCVRHYCRKLCAIYKFKVFFSWFSLLLKQVFKNVLWRILSKKEYRWPCLANNINQICPWDIRQLGDISRAVKELHRGSNSKPIYSIRVHKNKENAMQYAKRTWILL